MLYYIYNLLKFHPLINIAIAATYYLLVVIPHNSFGEWIAYTLDEPLGRKQYNLIILIIGIITLVIYVYLFWNGIRMKKIAGGTYSKKDRTFLWLSLLLAIVLIVFSFFTIIIINIEIIHLVQYALLAILLFPILQNCTATLFWIIIFGVLDEAYQYKILNPEKYDYYDFNDVILDLLGGILGVLLILANKPVINELKYKRARKHMMYSALILVILLGFAFLTGIVVVYPMEGIPEAPFQLIREYDPSFWRVVPPNVQYHVVRPLEGIFIILLLFIFYSRLDNTEFKI